MDKKSDRDISAWDARLKEQLERSFRNYHVRRIDLSVARDNEQLDWTGENLIVEKVSSATASAKVRLMFDDADQLILEENVEIKSIFNKIFLSNDVQADEWLDVIAGINFEYKKKIAEEAVAAGGGIWKTGQTILYQAGDDGDYEAGLAHNFEIQTLEGDGVVIDEATGLMWARDGNAAGGNNGALITWANALIYAEGLTFAGLDDWRMPNIIELGSIANFGAYNPATYEEFLNIYYAGGLTYWTSTTDHGERPDYAWVMFFLTGTPGSNLKTTTSRILCVRGGL